MAAVGANLRLLFIGQSIKPTLTYTEPDRLHVSVTRATAVSTRVVPALRRALAAKAKTIWPFTMTLYAAPFRSFVGQNGDMVYVTVESQAYNGRTAYYST